MSQHKPAKPETSYSRTQSTGLILGPLLFALTLLFFAPEGLSFEARAVLGTTLWVATWWITEAIPIPATSLLPLFLLPVTGALNSSTVTSAYGDDIIFLFLGGFFIIFCRSRIRHVFMHCIFVLHWFIYRRDVNDLPDINHVRIHYFVVLC